MKDLLVLLGKRVHDLRSAKGWSQEEFAHVSGLHRTYVGQIERGEKNISFGNLAKVSGVLGVTLSELLSALEDGAQREAESTTMLVPGAKTRDTTRRLFEIQKMVKRLGIQGAALEETIHALNELADDQTRPRIRNRKVASKK